MSKPQTTPQRPGDVLRAGGIDPVSPWDLAKQTGTTAKFWLNLQEAFNGR